MSTNYRYHGIILVDYGREDGAPYSDTLRVDGIFEGVAWIFVVKSITGEPIIKGKEIKIEFDVMEDVPPLIVRAKDEIALMVGSRYFGKIIVE